MKKIAVYAIGKDRPGIVRDVTGVLYRHRCSIEDSTMTILEGHFAMIMIVALPGSASIATFKKNFKALERKLKLIIALQELKQEAIVGPIRHQGKPFIISVLGGDRPGIVHQVSKLLALYKINITDLNTKVIGREGGRNAYGMVLEVEIPKSIPESRLNSALNKLSRTLKVRIILKPIETLHL